MPLYPRKFPDLLHREFCQNLPTTDTDAAMAGSTRQEVEMQRIAHFVEAIVFNTRWLVALVGHQANMFWRR